MALGQHIVLQLVDKRVLAPSIPERRQVARAVLKMARGGDLLAFGLADNHLHLLTASTREAAGQLARRIEICLQQRLALGVPFVPAFFKPISDGKHLSNTFSYILEQSAHHVLDWDPLGETCSLPDLLGLRLLGDFTAANVRRHLPRIKRKDLLACLGLVELQPSDEPIDHVLSATLATTCLAKLGGRTREATVARQVLIKVVGDRLKVRERAALLGISRRRVHELGRSTVDPRLIQAVRLQLGLMQQRMTALLRLDRPFILLDTKSGRDGCANPMADRASPGAPL